MSDDLKAAAERWAKHVAVTRQLTDRILAGERVASGPVDSPYYDAIHGTSASGWRYSDKVLHDAESLASYAVARLAADEAERAERESNQRDAARYRWIAGQLIETWWYGTKSFEVFVRCGDRAMEFGDALDAAMANTKGGA